MATTVVEAIFINKLILLEDIFSVVSVLSF